MLNFNVKPYYDDFDDTKNFHRILFKPGYAVQARELTQSQTILQNQVTKFADHIFAQNSPVSGGKVTVNTKCYYVKLQETYNGAAVDVNLFEGLLVKNQSGSVLARVIAVAEATGGDPPTLVLSYLSGQKFTDSDVIYDVNSNLSAQALATSSTGLSSTAHITKGVFYVLGNFVTNKDFTVILSKYSSTPSVRVGLNITETIHDYIDDSSLLDPAVGASNYQAPGADRYIVDLSFETRPLAFGDDQTFIELLRIENGQIVRKVDSSVYSVIDDYFAKRTYDTNGDYVVNDFSLTTKTDNDPNKYNIVIGKGVAYVHGYRLENQTPFSISADRARDTASENNKQVYLNYGNYLYVDHLRGQNGSFFDVSTTQAVDLHCVSANLVNTTNTSTYNATVVASGYVRGLDFDYYTSQSDANTYVYKAYVNDIQKAVSSANATAGGASTITFPGVYSTTSNSYLGVEISITAGPSAGDFRTITSYNGSTRVATVNSPWTTTPTSNSVFALNFGVKDAESMVSANSSLYILSAAALSTSQGRSNGTATGDVVLQYPDMPEMLFPVGMPYVATLADTSYTTTQMFRGITFTPSGSNLVAQLPFGGDYTNVMSHLGTGGTTLSGSTVTENFIVIVTNKGSSNYYVGDQLPWTINGRTVTLNADASIATLTGTSADLGGTFTATVIVKASVTNADNTGHILKRKNLITANTQQIISANTAVGNGTYTYVDDAALTSTGQVYIQNAGVVSPGNKQSLYITDVKRIVKIIDTGNANTAPNVAMLSSSTYDVTRNFIFDNGQRDNYYDHASVRLKIGAPKIKGNMLVLLDYYQHAGGDGYFSVESYLNSSLPEQYREIGFYTSTRGTTYSLKDCLDFRPTRQNGVYSFAFRYSNSGDTQRYGTLLPTDLSTFTTDYSYYLARKDKLVLTKDRSFQVIQGAPSINPIYPPEPDNSLLLANLEYRPYTGYIPSEAPTGASSDLTMTKVKHKRYTMQDISKIEDRISNLEYYTSLNLLEQQAQSLQITDAYGLNRFKNGIVVDNFSTFYTADTTNKDFLASINSRERKMAPIQLTKNFPLKALDVVTTYGGLISNPSSLGYTIDKDETNIIFSLPYTTANVASQKVASRSFNLNPFGVVKAKGVIAVGPAVNPPVTNTTVIVTGPTGGSGSTGGTNTGTPPVVANNNTSGGTAGTDTPVDQTCVNETYWEGDYDLGGYGTGHGGGQWVTHTVCIPKTQPTIGDWKTVSTGTAVNTGTPTTSSNSGDEFVDYVDLFVMGGFGFNRSGYALNNNQQFRVSGSGLLVNTNGVVVYAGGQGGVDLSSNVNQLNKIEVPTSTLSSAGVLGKDDILVDGDNSIPVFKVVTKPRADETTGMTTFYVSTNPDANTNNLPGNLVWGTYTAPVNPDTPVNPVPSTVVGTLSTAAITPTYLSGVIVNNYSNGDGTYTIELSSEPPFTPVTINFPSLGISRSVMVYNSSTREAIVTSFDINNGEPYSVLGSDGLTIDGTGDFAAVVYVPSGTIPTQTNISIRDNADPVQCNTAAEQTLITSTVAVTQKNIPSTKSDIIMSQSDAINTFIGEMSGADDFSNNGLA